MTLMLSQYDKEGLNKAVILDRKPMGDLIDSNDVRFSQQGVVQSKAITNVFEQDCSRVINSPVESDIHSAENIMFRGEKTKVKRFLSSPGASMLSAFAFTVVLGSVFFTSSPSVENKISGISEIQTVSHSVR